MKKYVVIHAIKISESCVVEAKNKKDAIQKAKKHEFYSDDETYDWDTGTVEKSYKEYTAGDDEVI